MPYKPSRRHWVKLWVNEWLTGTTRFELTGVQRSIFIDLLALAGRSKVPGVVASGDYEGDYRGYPLSWLAGTLVVSEEALRDSLAICERTGKISVQTREIDGITFYTVRIANWEKYQSEYQRQAKYRKSGTPSPNSRVTTTVTTQNTQRLLVEGEGRGEEEEVKREMKNTPPLPSLDSTQVSSATKQGRTVKKQPEAPKGLGPDFEERMIAKFPMLTPEIIHEEIELALCHVNAKKYTNTELYIQGWLRRKVDNVQGKTNRLNGVSRLGPGKQWPSAAHIPRSEHSVAAARAAGAPLPHEYDNLP